MGRDAAAGGPPSCFSTTAPRGFAAARFATTGSHPLSAKDARWGRRLGGMRGSAQSRQRDAPAGVSRPGSDLDGELAAHARPAPLTGEDGHQPVGVGAPCVADLPRLLFSSTAHSTESDAGARCRGAAAMPRPQMPDVPSGSHHRKGCLAARRLPRRHRSQARWAWRRDAPGPGPVAAGRPTHISPAPMTQRPDPPHHRRPRLRGGAARRRPRGRGGPARRGPRGRDRDAARRRRLRRLRLPAPHRPPRAAVGVASRRPASAPAARRRRPPSRGGRCGAGRRRRRSRRRRAASRSRPRGPRRAGPPRPRGRRRAAPPRRRGRR